MPGTLYVVSTPIGNLSDITLRALETLKMVDVIACENRDRHVKLLNYFEIKKHTIVYSPANEVNSAKGIVGLLKEGKNVALVSDAGVPGLSDPGRIVVAEAVKEDIPIVPVPGVSALTTLLSVAGFQGKHVVFIGFLPKTSGKQTKELMLYKDSGSILILFESQYRIKKLLEQINKIYGNVEIIIGREMTKVNESFIRGRVKNILENGFPEKGEFTVAVNTYTKLDKGSDDEEEKD